MKILSLILGMTSVLALGGCISASSTPSPRFYMLHTTDKASAALEMAPNVVIEVGPVKIPEYQNRPQMVAQDKDQMITFSEFDRWGEPLNSSIAQFVSQNFSVMLPGANLQIYPANLAIPIGYQVILDVLQLESQLDKDMFLVVQWSIVDVQNHKMLFSKRSEFRRSINPPNYTGLAQTLSEECISLSSEMSQKIVSLVAAAKDRNSK